MMRKTHYSTLWESYLQSVKMTSIDGNLLTAREILVSALNDAEDYNELDERLEWCTYGIADECRAKGDFNSARLLYKRLIETKEKILGPNHPNVMAGFEKLAMLQLKESIPNEKKNPFQTELNQKENSLKTFGDSLNNALPSLSYLVNAAVEKFRGLSH